MWSYSLRSSKRYAHLRVARHACITFVFLLVGLSGLRGAAQTTISTCQNPSVPADWSKWEESLIGAWYLAFPLCNHTQADKTINSVLDHSATHFYNPHDGIVVAFTGEKGSSSNGVTCSPQDSYVSDTQVNFSLGNRYLGPCGLKYLTYDGHSGFDFHADKGALTDLVATADGDLIVPLSDPINGQGKSSSPDSCFHTFYIDHHNGYTSWYLHSTSHIDPGHVKRGQLVGKAGATSCVGTVAIHLHFELRKGLTTPVDPYGWQGGPVTLEDTKHLGNGDPYIYTDPQHPRSTDIHNERISTQLWTNSGTVWKFDTLGNTLGWTPINVENYSVQNNSLNLDLQSTDPYIVGPPLVNMRAADFPAIEVSIASGAPDGHAAVYFTTDADPVWNEAKKVPLPCDIVRDGTFHTYQFPMSNSKIWGTAPLWRGNITQIRLDPADAGIDGSSSDTVSIAYIKMLTTAASTDCSTNTKPGQTFETFVSPSDVTIPIGGATTVKLTTVDHRGGNPLPAFVSIDKLPPTSTLKVLSANATTNSEIAVSIATTSFTPSGDYSANFLVSDGTSGHSIPVKFHVKTPSPTCRNVTGLFKPSWLAQDSSNVWAVSQGGVYKIPSDPAQASTLTSFTPYPTSFSGKPAIANDSLYVPLYNVLPEGQIAVIDLNTGKAIFAPVSPAPQALAAYNGKLYVADGLTPNGGSSNVYVVDGVSYRTMKLIPIGMNLSDIVAVPSLAQAYVAGHDSQDLSVLDLQTDSIISSLSLGIRPTSITYSGGYLYVVGVSPMSQDGKFLVLQTNPLRIIASRDTGRDPESVIATPTRIYITSLTDSSVSIFSTGSLTFSNSIPTAGGAMGAALDQNGNLFIANQSANSVQEMCNSQLTSAVSSIQIEPNVVQAGALATVTLQLDGPADISTLASLTSSIPGWAATNPIDVGVDQGVTTLTSHFRAPAVVSQQTVSLTALANNSQQSSILTLSSGSVIDISTTTLSFPNQLISDVPQSQRIIVTNHGVASPIPVASISGPFVLSNGCTGPLSDGGQCAIDVSYVPLSLGQGVGMLTLTDAAFDSPQTIVMNGNATDFALSPTVGESGSRSLSPGDKAVFQIDLSPLAGFQGTVTIGCQSPNASITCEVSQNSATLNRSSTVPFSLTITTAPSIFATNTGKNRVGMSSFAFCLMSVCCAVSLGKKRRFLAIVLLSVGLGVVAFVCGCGSGVVNDGSTPKGSYLVKGVAASSSGSTRTIPLSLVVK